ncbi:MAG: CIA30 family protein [Planctomycetota bacterium]
MTKIFRIPLTFLCLIVVLALPQLGIAEEKETPTNVDVLIDFKDKAEAKRWITVNDNVMGGRSKGGFKVKGQKLIFAGKTNTNGGGFSSIRTKPQKWSITDADGLLIRVLGDGRTYKADLLTDNKMQRIPIAYRADFETTKGEWKEIKIPFNSFEPTLYGSSMKGRTRDLDKTKIETIGFMIYDKKDGPFRLEVDWIKTYKAANQKGNG